MAKFYIAFGSNLNKKQMRYRCPTARPLGKFMMKDARLVFRGAADLEFAPGEKTPCGLWKIYDEDERALDVYEGIASGAYFKTREIEIEFMSKRYNPVLYLMNDDGIYPPTEYYINTIRRGYQDFGLDERYLDDAVKRSFLEKNATDYIVARRMRQRATERHRKLVDVPVSVRLQRAEQCKGAGN